MIFRLPFILFLSFLLGACNHKPETAFRLRIPLAGDWQFSLLNSKIHILQTIQISFLMKRNLLIIILFIVFSTCYNIKIIAQSGFGKARLINDGWLNQLKDEPAASNPGFDDSKWRKLDLPHDWSIEAPMSPALASCTGYLPGGIGWYRKTLEIPYTTVIQITIRIVDQQGNPVIISDDEVTCTINGPAKFLGMESGDNTDTGNWRDNKQRVYMGKLLTYIQTTGQRGVIELNFSAPWLAPAKVVVRAQ